MKEEVYIHPNLKPSDPEKYRKVVVKIRKKAMKAFKNDEKAVFISQKEYDILEDSVHESMKGRGHECFGIELKVKEKK